MTRREPPVRIQQMLDHAREALAMVEGRTRDDLVSDRMLNLAVVRLMEIVGEAAARVPTQVRQRYPDVPWQDVADFRNRLIHGYDAIDFDILWTILTEDLEPLIAQLDSAITSESTRS